MVIILIFFTVNNKNATQKDSRGSVDEEVKPSIEIARSPGSISGFSCRIYR
ncbi:Uncharacterised protein [Chryseobacterium indologenes]|nr:Uncharacterised protein [Chryseobacterium indologenes]